MQHPDEGTIHAWLDGQLPADEAARLDEHVASCAECAAKVAEARGLIAASSRIVTALDHTPRGVIPIESRKAPRRFQITPAITAIAATVVLAAGAMLIQKDRILQPPALKRADVADSVVAAPTVAPVGPTKSQTKRPVANAPLPTVEPQPRTRLTPTQKVAAPPPIVAPLPAPRPASTQALAETRADSARMNRAVAIQLRSSAPSSSAAASGGAGMGSRAPAMAADFAERRAVEDRALIAHIGCYETNESTDVLPRRFALDAGGQVRYVDSTRKRDGVIPDVTWTDSSGVAVIRNKAGTDLLRIRRQNNELLAEPATGDRRVQMLICAY